MNEDLPEGSLRDADSRPDGIDQEVPPSEDIAADVAVEYVAAEEADAELDLEDVLVLEEVEQELVLPVWEPTGVARVDETLDELTLLEPDDVHQHAEVYTAVHQRLRDTLSDLDTSG